MPASPTRLTTDILICGAGLAGLRAALAAKQQAPTLSVHVLAPTTAPAGSSFANRNNALGILCPPTDDLRQQVYERILQIGHGGCDPKLVRILLEEAPEHVEFLRSLGVQFRPNLYTGCFFPDAPVAYITDNLAHMHTALFNACKQAGVHFIAETTPNLNVIHLLRNNTAITGAIAINQDHIFAITARATILAIGGPASLFRYDISGPKQTGIGYALLENAGAKLANTSHLQWMWYTQQIRQFVPVHTLAESNHQPPQLLTERGTHCPYGWHQPDSAIDHHLLTSSDDNGIISPQNATPMSLMAHAGNGGAIIDENAATTAPGLYACGECATGMHGANRVGGAMILATQVFGSRAGKAAATHAANTVIPPHVAYDIPTGANALPDLPDQMQKLCQPGPVSAEALTDFIATLGNAIESQKLNSIVALQAQSARIIAEHRLQILAQSPA